MSAATLGVVGVLVLVAVLFFGQFVYWTVQGRRQARERELARRIGAVARDPVEVAAGLVRTATGSRDGVAGWLEEEARAAGADLTAADVGRRIAVTSLVGVLAMVVLTRSPLGAVGILAGAVPVLLLRRDAVARAERLTDQLPDALDLIARSLQAGLGVVEAMRGVAEEIPQPLAGELGRAWEEQNLGRDLRDVLGDLCRRNPRSFDLRMFTSAVLLQRETGGNLVEILGNLSKTIRARASFASKLRAMTSEARFTAWVLGGLPFAVGALLLLVQPGYLAPLVDDPAGRALLVGCACSFVVGIVLMRRAIAVEV